MALTLDNLTLGEIDTVESLSGLSIDELTENGVKKGKLLAAMAYVAKRRENPEYTFNEALGLTMTELEGLIDLGDEEDDEANLPAPKDHLPKQPKQQKKPAAKD